MYFDRFDIAEAYYLFLSSYYMGQTSYEYQRLSKLTKYFTPRYNLRYETLSENAQEIYHNLREKHGYA